MNLLKIKKNNKILMLSIKKCFDVIKLFVKILKIIIIIQTICNIICKANILSWF